MLMIACTVAVSAQVEALDQTPEKGVTYLQEGARIKMLQHNEQGMLIQEGYFLDGKPDGAWITYSSTGEITGKAYYEAGKRVGKWMVWVGGNEGSLYEISYTDAGRTVTQWSVENQVAIQR